MYKEDAPLSVMAVKMSVLLLVLLFPGSIGSSSLVHADQNSSGNLIVLCGTSVKNHVSVDGKVDIAFCIFHNESIKVKGVYYSYVAGGSEVNVKLHLNKTEVQNYTVEKEGKTISVVEIHEWWIAYNITPPGSDKGTLTVEYSGGSINISVPTGSMPTAHVSRTHVEMDEPVLNLPLIVTIVVVVGLLWLIRAILH